MRCLLVIVWLLGGAGCLGETHCDFCATGPAVPSVWLYDDGTTLSILSCQAQQFGPCVGTSLAMTATAGGQTRDVPATGDTSAMFGQLLMEYDHRLDVASPTSAGVQATYGPVSTEDLADLPAFPITGPTASVSRSAPPSSVHFGVLQNASASVWMTTACDARPPDSIPMQSTELGDVLLELGSLTGACSHRIDVAQTRVYLSNPPSDLSEQATRSASVTFTSTP